ncbi:MAG: alanine--tRNA ligase [Acidobacteriota bacterium]|nr:alanine--tRNA ligase [Acidobacteriota bacterium]
MTSSDIRTRFLKFFEARNHRIVPSSSLVPANDPTLLFSNAGMNQFKDVFLGNERRDYSRATTSQKCVRAGGKHNDLEQVGRTTRHHTFFEMLGNFSFGDYFKKEVIPWAWELITREFAIPSEKLYVTIFEGKSTPPDDIPRDDEAYECWRALGVPADRIFALGMKDNFWQMGETGPCGPCSEIHYDMGIAASDQGHTDCKFPCDCGRYVELWNLVFMQFNRDEQGVMTPLPKPSIDTGAGLERLAAVLQGKLSNFETDLFRPLIEEAAALANVEYGANHDADVSLRIIADHARSATFLISDGVLPSNEGRGYVLRLIMRRALYHGQTLGLNEPFLYKISSRVVDMMKDAYPELVQTAPHVAKAIKIEEEKYAQTTRIGIEKLNEAHVVLDSGEVTDFATWMTRPPSGRRQLTDTTAPAAPSTLGYIRGDDLFTLHDTFGLRPDFVEDMVKNYGLTVDRDGYEAEMQKQRERARASWKGAEKKIASPLFLKLAEDGKSVFDGYTQTKSTNCKIAALVVNGQAVGDVQAGAKVEIVLDHTPFYAESGGQVGDTGRFVAPGTDHEVAHVQETYQPVSGLIVHKAVAREGLRMGDVVTAVVDAERRDATRRNHTATHLLHAALRKTLGTHVKQAGSLVAPDRLRFDFTHYTGLGEQDLLDVEDLVNQHVLANEEMQTQVMDLDAAVNTGAMALFGEKYGDHVRVVSVGDGSYSRELCGGTHVRRTGDIGLFKIVSEGSVAAGTRRIEALTGTGVLDQLRRQTKSLAQASEALHAKPGELIEAIAKLSESEKKFRKEVDAQQMKNAASAAGDLVQQVREIKGVRVLVARVEVTDRSAMRQMIDDLRGKIQSGVIVLGSVAEGRVSLIAAVTKDLTAKLDAGKIVKQAATYVEGSGGGRKDLAEAGGKNPSKLDEALQALPGIIEQML